MVKEIRSGLHFIKRRWWTRRVCTSCRYVRFHKTGCTCGECLLLGRTLVVGDLGFCVSSCDGRVCDLWKPRPKDWSVYSVGVTTNPHWRDPYLPRETLLALREKVSK